MQTCWLASNFTNSAPLGRCSLPGMAASELSKRARSEETLQIMKDVKGQVFFRQGIISGVEVDLYNILFTLIYDDTFWKIQC